MTLARTSISGACLALFLWGSMALAADHVKPVQFAKGKSGAEIKSAVVRGDRDIYKLTARGGQTLKVNLTSLEDNAVFQIVQTQTGKFLRGAAEGQDTKSWSGPLPANGEYKIIVGGTRGNATYTLTIQIP